MSTPPDPRLPAQGGSYIRGEDGGLKKAQPASPATPAKRTAGKTPAAKES